MLKVGIIGCGNIFTMHATSCDHLQNATMVAVCDIKKDRADKAAAKYGVEAYYDYKELIDSGKVNMVHVCVPHYLHPIISKYALERGIHVLCEKPMSIKYEDALENVAKKVAYFAEKEGLSAHAKSATIRFESDIK